MKNKFMVYLLLVASLATTLLAQWDTSQMLGYVRDATDRVVPNAKVAIVNEGTGLERQSTTDAQGYFILANLPPGFYTVTVEMEGFKKTVRKSTKLDTAIPLSLDIRLEVGTVSESVEVTASTTTLQADSASVGRVIQATQIGQP